jgi:hypothetical protein
MKWILIYLVWLGQHATGTATFETKAACEAAKEKIEADLHIANIGPHARAWCFAAGESKK